MRYICLVYTHIQLQDYIVNKRRVCRGSKRLICGAYALYMLSLYIYNAAYLSIEWYMRLYNYHVYYAHNAYICLLCLKGFLNGSSIKFW